METYGGVEVQLHAFLTLTLRPSEGLASRLNHFTPLPGISPQHPLYRRLSGLRSNLGAIAPVQSVALSHLRSQMTLTLLDGININTTYSRKTMKPSEAVGFGGLAPAPML
jgi:hypothetical protein